MRHAVLHLEPDTGLRNAPACPPESPGIARAIWPFEIKVILPAALEIRRRAGAAASAKPDARSPRAMVMRRRDFCKLAAANTGFSCRR